MKKVRASPACRVKTRAPSSRCWKPASRRRRGGRDDGYGGDRASCRSGRPAPGSTEFPVVRTVLNHDLRRRLVVIHRRWSNSSTTGGATGLQGGSRPRASSTTARSAPSARSPPRSRPSTCRSAPPTPPSRRSPGSRSSAAGCRSTRSGSTCRRGLLLVARDDRGAGAGRGRAADRRRDAAPSTAMLATARELGIDEVYVDRRRAGDRRARLRHGDDPAGRQDRRPGQPLGDRGEAARLERGRHRPPCRAERGAGRRRRERRPGRMRRRPARPGRARPRQRGDPRHDQQPHRRRRASPGERRVRVRGGRLARRDAIARANELRAGAPRAARRRPGGRSPRGVPTPARSSSGTTAVLGDYAAGANHVLPTGGLARGAGGLGPRGVPEACAVRSRDAGGAAAVARRSRPSPGSRASRSMQRRWRSQMR